MVGTVGIHLVWTTYGTWLPGDDRGHWSPLFDFYGHLIQRGSRLNLPDTTTLQRALVLMRETPKRLAEDESAIVAARIADHLMPRLSTGPVAHACAVDPTHVHLLLGPVAEDIGKCAGRLKGTSSSALLKHSNYGGRQRTWTTGYWKVYLFDVEGLAAVQGYIQAHNVRRGMPASPYDWLRPI